MNRIVWFSWQYDLDLIALNLHPDFDMNYWMKQAVIAYTEGKKDFVIPLPDGMPYSVEMDNCYCHLYLSPEENADEIAFVNGIRFGFCNSALKNIFRHYLETCNLEPYFNEQTYRVKCRGKKDRAAKKDSSVVKEKFKKNAEESKTAGKIPEQAIREPPQSLKDDMQEPVKSPIPQEPSVKEQPSHVENTPANLEEPKTAEVDIDDDFDLFGSIEKMMQ